MSPDPHTLAMKVHISALLQISPRLTKNPVLIPGHARMTHTCTRTHYYYSHGTSAFTTKLRESPYQISPRLTKNPVLIPGHAHMTHTCTRTHLYVNWDALDAVAYTYFGC